MTDLYSIPPGEIVQRLIGPATALRDQAEGTDAEAAGSADKARRALKTARAKEGSAL